MKHLVSKTLLILFLTALLWTSGCNDDNDPSLANVRLEMKAKSELASLNTSARMMNSTILFEEVLMGVREIEFEGFSGNDDDDDGWDDDGRDDDDDSGDDDDDSGDDRTADGDDDDGDDDSDDDEIEFEGRFVVDMINGTSTPDFGIADLVPGTYREIEIESGPFLEDGNTLFIALEYQKEGEDPVWIEYSTKASFEIEIEDYSGIQLEGGSLVQILVLLDLDMLISGIDFSKATADEDGIIRINGTSNTGLASTIGARINKAFDAGEDRDDDDDIDDDDDDDDDDD